MKDRWAIHDKLGEADNLLNDLIRSLKDEEEQKELIKLSIEIDKLMNKLVW